jgi:hypothetical protein
VARKAPQVNHLQPLVIAWLIVGGFCIAVSFGPAILVRVGNGRDVALATTDHLIAENAAVHPPLRGSGADR